MFRKGHNLGQLALLLLGGGRGANIDLFEEVWTHGGKVAAAQSGAWSEGRLGARVRAGVDASKERKSIGFLEGGAWNLIGRGILGRFLPGRDQR